MAFSFELDYQRRLKAQQLSETKQWLVGVPDQAGVSVQQSISPEFLDIAFRPAQSSLGVTLDTPDGDRLLCTVHPNGSLVVDLPLEFFELLNADERNAIQPVLSEYISDLFHDDQLQFHYAISNRDGQTVLRAISSVGAVPHLIGLISEACALKLMLMLHLQQLLEVSDDASATGMHHED